MSFSSPRPTRRHLPTTLCFALILAAVHGTATATNLRMESSASWAENINRASSAPDWREAMRLESQLSLLHLTEWRTGFVTVAEGGVGFERVSQYAMQNAVTAGGSLQLRQKFGFGAYAPVLTADVSLRGRDARMNGNDGWTAGAALRASKRFTTWFRASLAADWQQHYADSPVFDTKHHRVYGTLAWQVAPWLSLTHGNGRLWGSFTANASPTIWTRALAGGLGRPIADYYNAVHWAATESFGPGWVTDIVDGRVNLWWLELSPALGPNTSLPLRYESIFSVNKIGVKYRQDVWTLQLIHRF